MRVLEINSLSGDLELFVLRVIEGVDGLVDVIEFDESDQALVQESDLEMVRNAKADGVPIELQRTP